MYKPAFLPRVVRNTYRVDAATQAADAVTQQALYDAYAWIRRKDSTATIAHVASVNNPYIHMHDGIRKVNCSYSLNTCCDRQGRVYYSLVEG